MKALFISVLATLCAASIAHADPVIDDQKAAKQLLGKHALTLQWIGSGGLKDAGKADSVLVYSTGGGDSVACKAIEDGVQDRIWSYDADGQGRDAATMIDLILQGATSSDGSMLSVWSPMKIIKAGDGYSPDLCWKM